MPQTRTDIFNKSLEIQQSQSQQPNMLLSSAHGCCADLLALYDVNGQIGAIEDLIAQGADMQVVLRLMCLASIITGGIKAKTLENLKREVLQVCQFMGVH